VLRRDIEFVVPLEISVPLWDAEGEAALVTVTSASVGQCIRMLEALEPVLDDLALLPPGLWDRLFTPGQATQGDLAEVLRLLAHHGEPLARMLGIATGIEPQRILALQTDRFVYLAALVIEVNHDFFARAAGSFETAVGLLQDLGAKRPTPRPTAQSAAAAAAP